MYTVYYNNLQKFPVSSASDVAPMLSSFRRPGIAAREDCWCVIMDSGMACCTLWGSMLKLAFWGMSTEVSWVVKFCLLWDTNQLLKKCFPFFWCDLNWCFILNQAKILVSIEFQNLFLKYVFIHNWSKELPFQNVCARVFTTQLHTPWPIRPKMKKNLVDTFQIKFDRL